MAATLKIYHRSGYASGTVKPKSCRQLQEIYKRIAPLMPNADIRVNEEKRYTRIEPLMYNQYV